MRIGAVYVHPDGTDWTGLDPLPLINIYDCSDNSKIIDAASLAELAEGAYKYTFSAYNPAKNYYWKIDGGSDVPTHLRYRRGFTELAGPIPDVQAGVNGGLPTVDASNYIAGIQGSINDFDGLNNISAVEVNAEIVDAINVDTYAEPGQGNPPATTSLANKIGYPYKMWRNKNSRDSDSLDIYNDAGDTVDQKAAIVDDGTTFEKGKYGTGP